MDFSFSGEQQAIRNLAREILSAEATPERVKQAETGALWIAHCGSSAPKRICSALPLPKSTAAWAWACWNSACFWKRWAGAVAPGPWFPTLVLGALPIAAFGTAQQQRDWLPQVAAGEALLSGAMEDAGSRQRQAPATRARKTAAGDWSLHGAKRAAALRRRRRGAA